MGMYALKASPFQTPVQKSSTQLNHFQSAGEVRLGCVFDILRRAHVFPPWDVPVFPDSEKIRRAVLPYGPASPESPWTRAETRRPQVFPTVWVCTNLEVHTNLVRSTN